MFIRSKILTNIKELSSEPSNNKVWVNCSVYIMELGFFVKLYHAVYKIHIFCKLKTVRQQSKTMVSVFSLRWGKIEIVFCYQTYCEKKLF